MVDRTEDVYYLAMLLAGGVVILGLRPRVVVRCFPHIAVGLLCVAHTGPKLSSSLHVNKPTERLLTALLGVGVTEVIFRGAIHFYRARRYCFEPVFGASLFALGCEHFLHTTGIALGAEPFDSTVPRCGSRDLNCLPWDNPQLSIVFLVALICGLLCRTCFHSRRERNAKREKAH